MALMEKKGFQWGIFIGEERLVAHCSRIKITLMITQQKLFKHVNAKKTIKKIIKRRQNYFS